jgi:hypothetical protein
MIFTNDSSCYSALTAVYAITRLDREKAREVAEWILANT